MWLLDANMDKIILSPADQQTTWQRQRCYVSDPFPSSKRLPSAEAPSPLAAALPELVSSGPKTPAARCQALASRHIPLRDDESRSR